MDPKSLIYNKQVSVSSAIAIIDEWLTRGHHYYWDGTPEELKERIKAAGETIAYHRLIEAVDSVETHKMPGHANKGLGYFKQEFKKLANGNSSNN
jgi:hypothetical protein